MKPKFLLVAACSVVLLQYSCNRMDKDATMNQARLTQGGAIQGAFSSMRSEDFCTLTAREPQLDFSLNRNPENNVYVYTDNQLSTGISNFFNNFRYLDGGVIQNLDTPDQKLSVNNLTQLYNVLLADSTVNYDPDSNYSGLRMHFGLEGKKIILIYEPVALKPTAVPKEADIVGTDKYYRVDASNNFVAISSTDFATLTNNLRAPSSKIYINHPNNSSVFSFINNSDATGDIRSNTMSMQEIVRVYCDNALSVSGSDLIKFSIVASQQSGSNYRMHVVVHHRMGLSTPTSGTYKNYAADYAQMCPVNCGHFNYNHY